MTAKKRFRRKQKKWKAWGAAIAAEEILMDQEANVLFPTMCDKLQKAMAIRPEYDITKEIITEQYQSDQQKRRYAPKLQQTAVKSPRRMRPPPLRRSPNRGARLHLL